MSHHTAVKVRAEVARDAPHALAVVGNGARTQSGVAPGGLAGSRGLTGSRRTGGNLAGYASWCEAAAQDKAFGGPLSPSGGASPAAGRRARRLFRWHASGAHVAGLALDPTPHTLALASVRFSSSAANDGNDGGPHPNAPCLSSGPGGPVAGSSIRMPAVSVTMPGLESGLALGSRSGGAGTSGGGAGLVFFFDGSPQRQQSAWSLEEMPRMDARATTLCAEFDY
jgi:hypothetical protein